MTSSRSRIAAAAAFLAALAAPAGAQESILDRPIEKEGWPIEITRRPLTLAPDMAEVTVPVDINLSKDRAGKPVSLAPSLYYGVADGVSVGIRHFLGLCVSGGDNGCPKVYDDVSVDTIWRLWRGSGTDLAFGAALNASPVTDPFTLSGEVRLIGRITAGPVALAAAPAFTFGITHRDDAGLKTAPLAFPLATYPYGFWQTDAGNKELLAIPVSLQFQATPNALLAVSATLDGPLNPIVGGFSDVYTIPVGAAVVVSPTNMFDLGASFTFLNLLGKQVGGASRADARGMQVFLAYRL
jgi:hypothetical protein